ncbi:hypothetical protein SAMN05428959_106100 [Duganella sp. CF517]|uniref:hypothetical protein n=1 Tax=Duganella sp. CF517 TaxID=1881038 RepID=UPI0008AA857B|nr:hypothetical protein [Duganella sp. CF517]SEO28886.1 hypothetical protein SAMN05428959_106100 [Duganella sp. CF517]
MKQAFFLVGVLALAGCASTVGHPALKVESAGAVVDRIATVTPTNAIFRDVPLKPMTASQSAARMN